MAEPTIGESARVLSALLSAGTVRRLDLLHEALCTAYAVGHLDCERKLRRQPETESCLEG